MSTEEPGTPQQPWGAEQPVAPERPRWTGRKTATAVAIAVVIAAGGGAAIWAATANDSGNQGPGGRGGPGFGGPGMGPYGMSRDGGGFGRGGVGALANALHGEFVIADGSTELLQTGKVTAVSANSISVTSTDNYAKTYTINSSTVIDSIKTGDQVTVIAKQTDNSALSVTDRANLAQDGPGGQGGQPPGQPGQQPPTR